MQPHYEIEMANNNNTLYHKQNLTVDDFPSSIFHTPPNTLTPNHIHHPILQHYYSQSPQQRKEQCHQDYDHFYQSYQHPHKFQPSQQHQQTHSLCDNIGNSYSECEGSSTRVSFWKTFNNTVLSVSDATQKQQQQHEKEKETCFVSDKNFSELEAVYKLGRNEKTTQPFEEQDLKRRTRKKMRKKKLKEEMGLMNVFFKRLVKRVVDHQEVLQNKLLEVIERMEKERTEREENWRRQESEIYEKEAIIKARERDLAKQRESAIVSSIEKITGRRFNLCKNAFHLVTKLEDC